MKRVIFIVLALVAALLTVSAIAQTKAPKTKPPGCKNVKDVPCPDGACQKFCVCQSMAGQKTYKCGCKAGCGGTPNKLPSH